MRRLELPGLEFLDDRRGPEIRVQDWLRARCPALLSIDFVPDPTLAEFAGALLSIEGRPVRYSVGMWIHRAAARFNLPAEAILTRWILEQGGTRQPAPYRLDVTLSRREPTDVERLRPGREWSVYHDADGPLLVMGDQVMFAALGFAIPDPKVRAPWNLEHYRPVATPGLNEGRAVMPAVGFPNQIALGAWFLRRQLDKWKADPNRVVKLYGGEVVTCATAGTYAALQYCPSEESGRLWAAVYRSSFGAPA